MNAQCNLWVAEHSDFGTSLEDERATSFQNTRTC